MQHLLNKIKPILQKIKLNEDINIKIVSKSYNELVEYYANNFQVSKLKDLMKEMLENDKIDINPNVYVHFLSIFMNKKENFSYLTVKKIFEKIKKENKLNVGIYKTMIILYSQNKYLNEMIGIFKEFEKIEKYIPGKKKKKKKKISKISFKRFIYI